MANLILNWLNNEIKLSKKINIIEEDFSNGFLFAEILHKYKQIINLNEYKNREENDYKTNNFKLLEKAFKDLLIKIERGNLEDIIHKKRGIATRYLYQIKMALSKKEMSFDNIMLKKSPYILENNEIFLSTKQINRIEGNTLMMLPSPLINTQLKSKLVKSNNNMNENNPMKRFEHFKKEQDVLNLQENKIKEGILNQNKKYINSLKINNTNSLNLNNPSTPEKCSESNAERKEILIQENKNQEKKNKTEKKLIEEMNRETIFYKNKISKSLNLTDKNINFPIENFENNINKLGLDLDSIDPKLNKISKLQVSGDFILKKIKDKIEYDFFHEQKEKIEKNKSNNFIKDKKTIEDFLKHEKNIFSKDSEININTSLNLNSSSCLNKRYKYENQRDLENRDLLKEKKRKIHENKIKGMYKNNLQTNSVIFEEKDISKNFDNQEYFKTLLKENLKIRQNDLAIIIASRKKNKILINKISHYLIDFVEEIYNYQAEKGNEEIKIDDWRNWSEMFINNQQFSVQKTKISYFDNLLTEEKDETSLISKNKINDSIENDNVLYPEITHEECEMLDYLNFIGKFRLEFIDEKFFDKVLNIEDVMGNEFISKSIVINKIISGINSKDYELKDEDIENLTIPKKCEKNYFLSDIIDIVLKLKYSENQIKNSSTPEVNYIFENRNFIPNKEESTKTIVDINLNKNIFGHIPIKMAIIGANFSGKKTQAKLLSENYPLKIYSVENEIKKHLEILEKFEIPIDQNPKYKNLKKNDMDKLILERQLEEQKFEFIKTSVINLKDILVNPQTSQLQKDDGVIEFCLELIKNDFPKKSTSQFIEEIIIKNKKKKEIYEEMNKLKEEKNNPKKNNLKSESQYNQDLNKISIEFNKGFILLDFPNNFSQAKILENKLSGFVNEIYKPKNEINLKKDNFSIIQDKNFLPQKNNLLFQGGLDLCIYLEGNSKEFLRRSKNRKIDPTTGIIYHMEDNPPGNEDKKIIERLVGIEENLQNSEDFIIESFKKYYFNINKLLDFYSIFGLSKNNFKTLNKIVIPTNNGEKSKDYKEQIQYIYNEITQMIRHVIKINEEKENELLEQSKYYNKDKDIDIDENNLNLLKNDAFNTQQNTELNISVNKDLQKTNNIIMHSNAYNEMEKNNEIIGFQIQNLDEEDFNKFHKKYLEANKRISSLIYEDIYNNWEKMHENYTSVLKLGFKSFKNQKESIISNYNQLQEKFLDFLNRPSKKNESMQKFINKYNKFIEEYPELKKDAEVKEEFNQDLADLGDRVWEIIDIRKNEAIKERLKIMSAGWIEKEMNKFYNNVEKLFIVEMEKFFTSIKIIRQFYFNMDSRVYQDISNFKPLDFLKDEQLNIIPLEKDVENKEFQFPKIEKLYLNCIKVLFKYDEFVSNLEKLMKSSTVNVSDTSIKKSGLYQLSRGLSKRMIDSTSFADDRKEILIYYEEMKKAINLEKNKFKFRVTFLKQWAIGFLTSMRKISKIVYNNLDNWIIKSIRNENNNMNRIDNYIRIQIEKGDIINSQIETEFFEEFEIINVSEFFGLEVI